MVQHRIYTYSSVRAKGSPWETLMPLDDRRESTTMPEHDVLILQCKASLEKVKC